MISSGWKFKQSFSFIMLGSFVSYLFTLLLRWFEKNWLFFFGRNVLATVTLTLVWALPTCLLALTILFETVWLLAITSFFGWLFIFFHLNFNSLQLVYDRIFTSCTTTMIRWTCFIVLQTITVGLFTFIILTAAFWLLMNKENLLRLSIFKLGVSNFSFLCWF